MQDPNHLERDPPAGTFDLSLANVCKDLPGSSNPDKTNKSFNTRSWITALVEAVVLDNLEDSQEEEDDDNPPRPILVDRSTARSKVEMWEHAHPLVIWDSIGMDFGTFRRLCTELEELELVEPTFHSPVQVKVGLTLWMLRKAASSRMMREVWQLSQATMSSYIHEVIDALFDNRFYSRYVKQSTPDNIPADNERYTNHRYVPLTTTCLGAIDGTFVTAKPPTTETARFRTRKRTLAWNVLACVDFDGLFTYVLAGWEGPAHDGTVYASAITHGLNVPQGRYYLADAGYPNNYHLLTPYRGTRYHLREWESSGKRYISVM